MERIPFDSRRTTRLLFTVLGVLLALHLVVAFGHVVLHVRLGALTELVDLDLEANLPTFFNALLFFIGAAFFFLHGKVDEARQRLGWFLLFGIFIFLGLDEGSQIHEKFMGFTKRLLAKGNISSGESSWLFNAWVLPYLAALATLSIILWKWFWRLTPPMRKGLVISGAVYVMGAAGMEMASSKLVTSLPAQEASLYPWMPCDIYGGDSCWLFAEPRYIALYTLEELGEMTGLILCIRVLLRGFEAKGATPFLGLDKA